MYSLIEGKFNTLLQNRMERWRYPNELYEDSTHWRHPSKIFTFYFQSNLDKYLFHGTISLPQTFLHGSQPVAVIQTEWIGAHVGLWETVLKFLYPGLHNNVTEHLA